MEIRNTCHNPASHHSPLWTFQSLFSCNVMKQSLHIPPRIILRHNLLELKQRKSWSWKIKYVPHATATWNNISTMGLGSWKYAFILSSKCRISRFQSPDNMIIHKKSHFTKNKTTIPLISKIKKVKMKTLLYFSLSWNLKLEGTWVCKWRKACNLVSL